MGVNREQRNKSRRSLRCNKELWRGREAYRLSNDLVQLITLTGGGHIAEFRFTERRGSPKLNPLWTPPWKSIDPDQYSEKVHETHYGPVFEGKLLSGIAGHNLCLDYFGSPSPKEAKHGISTHGEAPNLRWRKISQSIKDDRVTLALSVKLLVAGLTFQRQITLRHDQPVAYFKETVYNDRKCDHFFHWVQHVTLGPPFISKGESMVFLPGTKGFTFPFGYNEGKALLANGRSFLWPNAPARSGISINLENVLIHKGLGFVASVLIDPRRDWGYVCALNAKHRLLIGYCFRREDFPWVAVWEENRAIHTVPWKKRTETRGLEFGSTPIPSTRRDSLRRGNLYDTETFTCVPARGRKTVEYWAFLAQAPAEVRRISDVRNSGKEILISGDAREIVARIPIPSYCARESVLKSKTRETIGDCTKLWLSFCLSLSHTRRSFGKLIVLALLPLLAVGFCGFGSTPGYNQIEKAIKEGKLAAARQELENLVQADPNDYQAQLLLGIVLDEQREPSEAVKHLKIAERLRPGDRSIRVDLGKHYAQLGQLPAAKAEYEKAIQLDPSDPVAHNDLGLVLIGLHEPVPALSEFQEALRRSHGDLGIWLNLFKTQLVLKEFSDARVSAQNIVKLGGPSPELYAQLGALQAERGDYDGAIENLIKARQLSPKSYDVLYNLGLAYYRDGQLQSAARTLDALRQRRDTAELEDLLGDVFEKEGRYLDAVRAYKQATKLDPKEEAYWYDYVLELLLHKTFDAALLVAGPASRAFPSSLRLRVALGVAYLGSGHYDQALGSFMSAAEQFPNQGLSLYFLGLAAQMTGEEMQPTMNLVSNYMKTHPADFWPYYFLACQEYRSELRSGQNSFAKPIDLLKHSIQINPNYPDSHLELGILYSQVKNWDAAIQQYKKAIELDPQMASAHYRLAAAYRHLGEDNLARAEDKIFQQLHQRETQEEVQQRRIVRFLYELPGSHASGIRYSSHSDR